TSEPVSQATMRIVKVFWGLDSSLAYARHFPAINWLTSYSLYVDTLRPWYDANMGKEFMADRERAMTILGEEANLQEIVKLVGADSLGSGERLTLETAKMIREDFLQQNAFVDVDSFSSYDRQLRLLKLILDYDALCREALGAGADMEALFKIASRERIGRAKTVPADTYEAVYAEIDAAMREEIAQIRKGA
ncbi:MAG: V-type ATP synthase subunit A, partial [Oscillospiraceae bacterium]|nr:V-type ATP synthase subunit A [Oscillospiraceae bacterium]